ncbi:pyridoxal phosphate-dependent aminotransferase [Actinomadura scrupuli]|uniref:pyridoxal phosphate-dependent aminotransferase n=1 Tax=Actinomadura scrupuli TaxID=559629 RepID=UPI003D99E89B
MPDVSVSPTLAANEAVLRRRQAGLPVLPLGFGEAGLPVHPALTAALSAAAGRGGYGPVAGLPALRAAAAGYWRRRGLDTDPELVVCGPGSKPLLYALLLAIGGRVALPRPSWVSYAAQARLTGGPPVLLPTLPGQGGVPDPSLLAGAARSSGVRAVVVTIPDNPTGTLPHRETVRRLCAVAREHDLLVISDEIYRDLVHDPGVAVPSPAEYAPERTIVTTGLSKNLALGGWRLGVARIPGAALRAQVTGIASEIWSSPPVPVQHAAAFAFTEPDELTVHIARSRDLHAAVAGAAAARFTGAGASLAPPRAAFYLYPDLSPLGAGRTDAEAAALLLDRHGVVVLPGSAFGEPAGAMRVRVATSLLYGDSEAMRWTALTSPDPLALPWIAKALDLLSEALEDLRARLGAT